MSVIVKNMEMPEECNVCQLANYNMGTMYCKALPPSPKGYHVIRFEGKREDCPLVEVKEPHGRLGDLDELMTEFMDSDLDHLQRDDWREVIQIVADAPTVIEAEGSEA